MSSIDRLGAEFFQVGILGQPGEIAVAKLQRLFKRERGAVKFLGQRIAAREIVKDERIFRFEPREAFVHLASPSLNRPRCV